MNIFVGNLSFDATEADVRKAFEGFGSVASVFIVMEKKKAKSRGFGFVDMLDDQQAQAAIAALDGKEFMGRPLNVSPARPKPQAALDRGERKEVQPRVKDQARHYPRQEQDEKNTWFAPVFKKTGGYKGGRRTRSFMARRAAAGIEEPLTPKRKNRDNPMRWRKKHEQTKPWQKNQGDSKPWRKSEGGGKHRGEAKREEPMLWSKTEGKPKPWRKNESHPKPWRKTKERRKDFSGFKR